MKKVIIFDFDGTLHETMHIYKPAIVSVVKWLNEECGVQVEMPSDRRISSWLGMNMADMWRDFMPELDLDLRQKAGRMVGDWMQENLRKGKGRLYDGVEEMLDSLCAKGYLLAMLSNCGNHHAQVQWDIYGLERWFTVFFTCETWNGIPKHEILKDIAADFSGAMEKSPVKRDGLPMTETAGIISPNRTGGEPDHKNENSGNGKEQYQIFAYVGDRDSDLAAAQAVGAPFIGCLYGYGSRGELEESTAFAGKPAEIAERLGEL